MNHIRKSKKDNHIVFLYNQEQEMVKLYIESKKDIHKRLDSVGNIFAGISYEKIMLTVAKYLSSKELESIRKKRISSTMKTLKKTKEHNSRVSQSVKKAWAEGKFSTEKYKKSARRGYKKRRSYSGKNNPMYGKPSPKGAGRGKGGIRKDIGHYVRSTWEANICRVCKYINRIYQFEPKRFEIIVDGEDCTYCPDFYFPTKNFYYEVKGHAKSSSKWECTCDCCVKNRKKIKAVVDQHGISIVLIGNSEYKKFKNRFRDAIPLWEN